MQENCTPYKHWHVTRDRDGIVWLALDRAGESVNTLGIEILEELESLLDALERERPVGLVIESGKDTGFIAGADIREFDSIPDRDEARRAIHRVHALFARLENLSCPRVAAIEGFCLGGGLELALACSYRVAAESDESQIGFPEIRLGIFPAFGGTARSVRLLGGFKAISLILASRQLTPAAAKSIGLIDELVPRHRSLHWAARKAVLGKRKSSVRSRIDAGRFFPIRYLMANLMQRQATKRVPKAHYPAPYALIELWRKRGSDFRALLDGEADLVSGLLFSETACNLRRVYHLQETLKALGRRDGEQCGREIPRVHVIGAGVMGGDIAAWCALRGLEVSLQDREEHFVAAACKRAQSLFRRKLRSDSAVAAAQTRLLADVLGNGITRADVIIEAIVEDPEAKKQLFAKVEQRAPVHAVLATNTSSIPLEEIASGMASAQRLIGLHFFNPVARMPLVEVVHDSATDPQQIELGCRFAARIGKLPLPVRSAPGFLVNRVLAPYMLEALRLAQRGNELSIIDAAAEHFGMPVGPIELADTVGIDIARNVAENLAPDNSEAIARLDVLIAEDRLGKKTGRGLYRWKKGRAIKPKRARAVSLDALAAELLQPMLEQCRQCLADGIVESADLVDAGVIFGTGFAPFRGGPLHYLRQLESESEVLSPDGG